MPEQGTTEQQQTNGNRNPFLRVAAIAGLVVMAPAAAVIHDAVTNPSARAEAPPVLALDRPECLVPDPANPSLCILESTFYHGGTNPPAPTQAPNPTTRRTVPKTTSRPVTTTPKRTGTTAAPAPSFNWNGYYTDEGCVADQGRPGWVAIVSPDSNGRIKTIIADCPPGVMVDMINNAAANVTHTAEQVAALQGLIDAENAPAPTVAPDPAPSIDAETSTAEPVTEPATTTTVSASTSSAAPATTASTVLSVAPTTAARPTSTALAPTTTAGTVPNFSEVPSSSTVVAAAGSAESGSGGGGTGEAALIISGVAALGLAGAEISRRTSWGTAARKRHGKGKPQHGAGAGGSVGGFGVAAGGGGS